jgi:hypothetical protein
MELMNGSQFAKDYVNEYLKNDFPIRLINYRNGWQVDDLNLPTPVSFFTYEPLAMDAWPTIITVVMSTNKLERIGHAGGDPLYRVNYSMRTYVWVRDEHSEPTTRMRDRLTTVLRSSLMDYPCLKAYDDRKSFRIEIDESSIQEQFSDLTLLKGDRVLAGAYISYDLAIDEVVTRMPIAPSADEINTTVSIYSLTSEQ